MKTKDSSRPQPRRNEKTDSPPFLTISKLGIISRDYRTRYDNGYRDFSHAFADVLNLTDAQGCDAVLFSLFSIIPRNTHSPLAAFEELRNINAVLLEEFQDINGRESKRYVVYHRTSKGWAEYEFFQAFGTIRDLRKQGKVDFVEKEMPRRILGNCCVLLCGEINGVRRSKKEECVHDELGLRAAIPEDVKIVLNPTHDRMIRFEMKLKRQFLSENDRWVISVWNKGKVFKDGKTRDGSGAAWTIFHNGEKKDVDLMLRLNGVDIGILDFSMA